MPSCLPKELLIRILSYVFGYPSGLLLWRPPRAEPKSVRPGLAILRNATRYADVPDRRHPSRATRDTSLQALVVCREFYYAGIEAYYGGRTFYFATVSHLTELTRGLGADRRRCIRHIVISLQVMLNKRYLARGTKQRFVNRVMQCHPLDPCLELKLANTPIVLPFTARDLRIDPLTPLPLLRSVKIVAYNHWPVMWGLYSLYEARLLGDVEEIIKAAWSSSSAADLQVEWDRRKIDHLAKVCSAETFRHSCNRDADEARRFVIAPT